MRVVRLLLITVVVLALGFAGWWFFVRTTVPEAGLGDTVRQESLDTSLLRDQLFTRLRAPTRIAPAQIRGRENPFAPPVLSQPAAAVPAPAPAPETAPVPTP